jgi:DUF4097 and DUF4098 domain-containing protein YvlB
MRVNHRSLSLCLLLLGLLVATPAAALETAETILTAEGNIGPGGTVVVENLLGSVRLVATTSPGTVKIEALVAAEAKQPEQARALADSIRIDRVTEGNETRFHVVFPVDQHNAFRLPKSGMKGTLKRWTAPVLKNSTPVDYDGTQIEVGANRKATGLAVYLTVTVPYDRTVVVRQRVGSVNGRALRGSLHVATIDGQILLERCLGSLHVETERGDIRLVSFQGDDLRLTSKQGKMELREIRAANTFLRTETGTIHGAGVVSENLHVESTSGDVQLGGMEPRRVEVKTVSGKVDLATNMKTLREAVIQSATGDVTLRVGELTHFDLHAETRSGAVKTLGGVTLDLVAQDGLISQLKHGQGGPHLRISALGGNLTIRPYDGSRLDLLLKN